MDQFWKACGAVGPLRLEIKEPHAQEFETREFDQPFVRVGRNPAADLSLWSKNVGPRHVYFQVVGSRLYAIDLASRSGTWWPEGPKRSGWMNVGDTVNVGGYMVRFGGLGPAGAESEATRTTEMRTDLALAENGQAPSGDPFDAEVGFGPPDLGGAWGVVLEIRDGPDLSTWPMDRTIAFVGKRAGCRIRLTDFSVSTIHCALVKTPAGLWVVDLLSQTLIAINGSMARVGHLEDGDELRVGKTTITARYRARGLGAFAQLARPVPGRGSALSLGQGMRPPTGQWVPAPLPEGELGANMPEMGTEFNATQFDHFRQAILMAFQMIATTQNEQHNFLREELDRLQGLAQQLRVLRAEMATLLAKAPGDRPSVSQPPLFPPFTGQPGPVPFPPGLGAAPFSPSFPSAPPVDSASSVDLGAADDALIQLRSRLSAIQEESQSRWQKVLGFLTSPLRDDFVP